MGNGLDPRIAPGLPSKRTDGACPSFAWDTPKDNQVFCITRHLGRSASCVISPVKPDPQGAFYEVGRALRPTSYFLARDHIFTRQSKQGRRCQEVAIIGVDFWKTFFGCTGEVQGIGSA